MVEHQGIAPCIPVWKVLADGHQRVSLNTYAREMESRVRVALTCEVLRTTAWLLGQRDFQMENGECRMQTAEFKRACVDCRLLCREQLRR